MYSVFIFSVIKVPKEKAKNTRKYSLEGLLCKTCPGLENTGVKLPLCSESQQIYSLVAVVSSSEIAI